MTTTVPERRRSASNWIPIGSFVVALLMAVFVLPTILRQSPPQTNQTAQLSPDAPQNNQQSLIAALNRGSTSTAGAGAGKGAGAGGGKLPPVKLPQAQQVPSYCPYGYGTPKRQTFSVYSAPCAGAFSGDNGGATSHGVTATQINVGIYGGTSGPITDHCGENAQNELNCDWQAWINSRYQFYGRQLRMYYISGSGQGQNGVEAGAVSARAQNMFGMWELQLGDPAASVGQKLVTWVYLNRDSFFKASAPYGWSWSASEDRIIDVGSEFVCKQLKAKPPTFNKHTDLTFDYSKPRKFGAVVLEREGGNNSEDVMKAGLARCGIDLGSDLVSYDTSSERAANAETYVARFKQDKVTTVLFFGDQVVASQAASAATRAQYFPEWVVYGTPWMEANSFNQSIDPSQWAHAVGFDLDEVPRATSQMDWYIAACQVDPNCANLAGGWGGESSLGTQRIFDTAIEMANGFQLAGPHLTPESNERGLHTLAMPPNPEWAVGGSFQDPEPWSFEKYASFAWWDPNGTDPTNGNQGAWVYVNNARRYTTGEIPTAPMPFFKYGTTQAPSG